MNKRVLVLIFVLLILANAYIYKLSLEKKDVGEESSQISLEKITNIYHWFFGSIIVLIVFILIFAFLRRDT